MVREKILSTGHQKEVIYDEVHWHILNEKRNFAKEIMQGLEKLNPNIHGSLARGDIHKKSDIDIILLNPVHSYKIELELEKIHYYPQEKWIIQATPKHTPKGKIILEEEVTISFPLIPFTTREIEFYKFGGMIDLNELKQNIRVPGINKKLVLIFPTEKGHKEFSVLTAPSVAARIVGVGIEIVNERIKVLRRRDKIGRTGIFFQEQIGPTETFETKFKSIISKKPEIKRLFRKRGVML
ncbi:MAG: nucleotidyltransferase domain-containing protein [Candidatus Odinarchaeota archaeon]|nr:nucleotidyltransferase domain-containing protein [Candidatus Odinarchaeota archaeon]